MGRQKTKFVFKDIPTSWNDITLEHFIRIQNAYEESDNNYKSLKVIAAITNTDVNELENAPAIIAEKLYNSISFINQPLNTKPNNEIIINDEKYFIHYENELTFGEYVDVQDIMEANNKNYGAILAVLCRKEKEEYNDDYKLNKFTERMEMFNNQPIINIYPVIGFFLLRWMESPTTMNKYSDLMLDQGKQAINLIENYLENGDGRKYYTNSQMKTLQKLKLALNSI